MVALSINCILIFSYSCCQVSFDWPLDNYGIAFVLKDFSAQRHTTSQEGILTS